MQIQLKKYKVTSPKLQQFINFFWSIDSADITLHHEVLPLKNIDLIFNLSPTSLLEMEGRVEKLGNVYFHGLSESYSYKSLKSNGEVKIIGVSFKPFGLYPFVNIPMKEFSGLSINFELVCKQFTIEVFDKIKNVSSIEQRLNSLESGLLTILDDKYVLPQKTKELISCFDSNVIPQSIDQFCCANGIHKRKLERVFSEHVGISPKSYMKLVRYHKSLNHLIFGNYKYLSDVAFDNGYYDQMHFVRDFKQFAGVSPTTFLKKENYLKKISRF